MFFKLKIRKYACISMSVVWTVAFNCGDFAPQGKFGHVWRHFWMSQIGIRDATGISDQRLVTPLSRPQHTERQPYCRWQRSILAQTSEVLRLRNPGLVERERARAFFIYWFNVSYISLMLRNNLLSGIQMMLFVLNKKTLNISPFTHLYLNT